MIADLVRGRRWAELADALAALEGEELEAAVCLLLGTGRLEGIRAELSRRAGKVALPMTLRLLVADGGVRVQSVALYELLELDRRLQTLDVAPVQRLWMSTLLAEHGLWRGDLAAVGHAYGDAPGGVGAAGPLADILEARRLRIRALVAVVANPDDPEADAILARVGELLRRADCPEELLVTEVLLAYGRFAISDDQSESLIAALRAGVDGLARLGSDRVAHALLILAWTTWLVGDIASANDVIDELDLDGEHATAPPIVLEPVRVMRLLSRMLLEGPEADTVAGVRACVDQLRRHAPAWWLLGPIATGLLDCGEHGLAREIVDIVDVGPSIIRAAAQVVAESRVRLDLLDGAGHGGVEAAWELVHDWERSGRKRRAALGAVRLSWTCRRVGLEAAADELFDWGAERLPAESEQTHWERAHLGGTLPEAGRFRSTGLNAILALRSDLVVMRYGFPVSVGEVQARLLALLVAARRPVTTDWIVTALWPDSDLDVGRNRLNQLIHRTRQRLELVPGELLLRDRTGVALDAEGWYVDVWDFWQASSGDVDERERALDIYEADLVARQLAYDDMLADEREVLRNRWRSVLDGLVEAGRVSAEAAQERVQRLGHMTW